MILNFCYALLVITLLFVLYQDTKKRQIHVILPLLVFCFALLINYASVELRLIDVAYNSIFLIINILGLTLYFSLKVKTFFNPIDSVMGLGDIIFFLAITPLFKLKNFILFFITGLLFSLFIHGITLLIKKAKTIPLAGYLSLFLIISVVLQKVCRINFFL